MQDLTLVGVHDDGEHLVLSASDGQRYRVRVDESMRAAVRRDRPRLGQLQIETDGRLRPRDIQARIRAGESAEGVAEDSGLPIEYVRRYEGPVLAEREFVVRQARAVRLRGVSRDKGGAPSLDDLVTERLSAREVQLSTLEWDAWRTEDGTWTVALTFTAGTRERRARWAYDAQLRHVSAQDDEARWLTDDEASSSSPGAATHRRLVPIRSADPSLAGEDLSLEQVYDVEADGSVQAVTSWPSASTVDLLDTLRERRGRRQRPVIDHDYPASDDDRDEMFDDMPGATSASARPTARPSERPAMPPAAHPPVSRPELAEDAEVLDLPDTPPSGVPASTGTGAATTTPAAVTTGQPAGTSATPSPSRRTKRASVPSWDDIVFGGRRE